MLSYLEAYKESLQWEDLLELKKERDLWWERESAKRFKDPITKLPQLEKTTSDFSSSWVSIKSEVELLPEIKNEIEKRARALIPWKKGPFSLFDLEIDAEWRSDLKWDRLKDHLPDLKDKVIMDIGCNNGYFMFRMAEQNPKLVLGIDPVLQIGAQFKLINHFAKQENLHFELFGVEHLNLFKGMYDLIFHMGIIYHHRHPIQQLIDIREALKPGGQAIIETIGIPGEESIALFPEDRYARMGNVWFVPTLSCFVNWAKKAKFIDIEVIADTNLEHEEQRLTQWCPPPNQSLVHSLDPDNPSKTVEGHPAPRRFCLSVRKKLGK